jgi:hypothetical protein
MFYHIFYSCISLERVMHTMHDAIKHYELWEEIPFYVSCLLLHDYHYSVHMLIYKKK